MQKLLKTTALISLLTFFSRVLGLVRDGLIAMIFGTNMLTDAFFIAFRPFDLCRKLFSEGILNISFIPVFSGILARDGREKAFQTAFSFFYLLSLAGTAIVLLAIVSAPLVMNLIAPGFSEGTLSYDLTRLMFKIMLPYFLFIMLTAVCIAVLNALGRFAVPAVSPILLNLVVIAFTIWVCPRLNHPVTGLASGVLIGGGIQLVTQLCAIKKEGIFKNCVFKIKNTKALRIAKIALPCMVGAASYQINMVLASIFASNLAPGNVSYLYFADRLVQFPMALFTISAVTVLLPDLSRKAGRDEFERIGPVFEDGLILILFITIPAMAGLMALDRQIVALLFGRGQFETQAVVQTAQCLFYLVTGLWIFTCSRFLVTLHFSIQSIRVPFFSGVISIGFNLAGAYWWMKALGLNGLVFSIVFSSLAGLIYLVFHPPAKIRLNGRRILVCACRSFFLSVIMFFIVKTGANWIPSWQTQKLAFVGLTFLDIVCGILFYLGAGCLISSPEAGMIFGRGKKRLK